MGRVVVVPQQAVLLYDFHVADPGGIQNALGGFCPGQSGGGGNLAPLGVGNFDFGGRPKREGHRSDESDPEEYAHEEGILKRGTSGRKGGPTVCVKLPEGE